MIRQFIIMVGSRPVFRALSYGMIREWIEAQSDDITAQVSIWRVYPLWMENEPSTDATEDFLRDWIERVESRTRPGLRPNYPASSRSS